MFLAVLLHQTAGLTIIEEAMGGVDTSMGGTRALSNAEETVPCCRVVSWKASKEAKAAEQWGMVSICGGSWAPFGWSRES